MHYIGMQYFIQEPWSLPPGRFSGYGDGVATSIVYPDSVPLVSILFKLLLRTFKITGMLQPFGIFIASCYIFQGIFAFRLLRWMTKDRWIGLAGTLLLLLSPPIHFRLSQHHALAAHWLILWALCLFVRPSPLTWKANISWLVLFGVGLGINFYLSLMCGAIYGAALLLGLWKREISLLRFSLYVVALGLLLGGAGWFYGYFIPADLAGSGLGFGGGYGFYKFNLLGFFNPLWNYSLMVPSLPSATAGEYEGFAWLGAGLVLMAIASIRRAPAIVDAVSGAGSAMHLWFSPFLVAALIGTTAIALTQHVNLGGLDEKRSLCLVFVGLFILVSRTLHPGPVQVAGIWNRLFTSPLSGLLTVLVGAALAAAAVLPCVPDRILEITRGSGRMVWPVYYWFSIWLVANTALRYTRPAACLILLICAGIQIADMAPKAKEYNDQFSRVGGMTKELCALPSKKLTQALWALGKGKKHLWVVSDHFLTNEWDRLCLLACYKGMGINRPYLARCNGAAIQKQETEILGKLESGDVPKDVVYYIYPESRNRATLALMRAGSHLKYIEENGVTLLMKSASSSAELGQSNLRRWREASPCLPIRPGQTVSLEKGNPTAVPAGAITGFDALGGWTTGTQAFITLKALSPGADAKLSAKVCAFLDPQKGQGQAARIYANNTFIGEWKFTDREITKREILIPGNLISSDSLVILVFEIVHPTSPKSAHFGNDPRTLGIQIRELTRDCGAPIGPVSAPQP